ncbi:MAG TPA: hypothetical protein VF020_08270, partial [Chthoniobacterales bacterium]
LLLVLVLVVVLVLERATRVDVMCDCPTPGGEPLWHVPGHFAIFISRLIGLKRVKTGGSRERPSAMPFTRGLRFAYIWTVALHRAG